MMRFFNAKVRGGRLTLDEPTELPDGTLVELVPTDTVVWLVQRDERAPLGDDRLGFLVREHRRAVPLETLVA